MNGKWFWICAGLGLSLAATSQAGTRGGLYDMKAMINERVIFQIMLKMANYEMSGRNAKEDKAMGAIYEASFSDKPWEILAEINPKEKVS